MRTNLNFAKNFHRDYPNHNKNQWADSLSKGDIILVDGSPVIYVSHRCYRRPNGMGGNYLMTEYTVVSKDETTIIEDRYTSVKPIGQKLS